MAKTKSGKTVVVANYLPPGNREGEFKKNVPPPKGGKTSTLTKPNYSYKMGTKTFPK